MFGWSKTTEATAARHDAVVLVHGLAAHPLWLSPIERHLAKRGFVTRNWTYRSILGSIEKHAEQLLEVLAGLEARADIVRVHLVTHSMGCIVARQALIRLSSSNPDSSNDPDGGSGQGLTPSGKLGRIVMLAPPNRGSRVASLLAPILGAVCRPLSQLADTPDSFVRQLAGMCHVEVGILAAAYDRVVSVESTHLPGEADHLVVPSGHASMLWRPEVAELVANFLTTGAFRGPSPEDAAAPAASPEAGGPNYTCSGIV